jgi:competence protein ComEC
MNRYSSSIICIAYAIGLLSTGILASGGWLVRISGLSLLTLVAMVLLPRIWWLSPPRKVWLLAGIVAILASIYLDFRTPYPIATDISGIVSKRARNIEVSGEIISESRLNRKGNLQFWLQVHGYRSNDLPLETATGKLYVTLPNRESDRVYRGQKITIQGLLYRPRPATNPGSFDFRSYLARQGAFAGLKGKKIIEKSPPPMGIWQIRKRMVRSQIQGLGKEKGALVSSIVLGRSAIDLPMNLQDLFIKTGLAHVLAASGFQVTLLLGVVLGITQRLSPRTQFIIGTSLLLFYLALTGIQPSVARAVLMGIAALLGILYRRNINPLGSLLGVATLLLLYQPLWIWDLGFQLSFLATLGLIVTLPAIQTKIDFLPSFLADPIGITLAATLWTLPLLLYTFSSIALYSIPLNILTNPLLIVISLGGTISAFAGLLYPPLGSLLSSFLYYPIALLLQILTFFTHLPMSTLSTGKLSLGGMLIIYSLLVALFVNPWLQRRWIFVGLFILSLILIPILYSSFTLTRVTIFATRNQPAIAIQNRGQTILLNGQVPDTARYTVLPFLQQQGINSIQGVIAVNTSSNWSAIRENIPIEREINLEKEKNITLGAIAFQFHETCLEWQLQGNTWLWVTQPDRKVPISLPSPPLVLLWKGRKIEKTWLETLHPRTAIAITNSLSRTTRKQLETAGIDYFQTGRDGAIQWTPNLGFQSFGEDSDRIW